METTTEGTGGIATGTAEGLMGLPGMTGERVGHDTRTRLLTLQIIMSGSLIQPPLKLVSILIRGVASFQVLHF